jgi:hypothetical protein
MTENLKKFDEIISNVDQYAKSNAPFSSEIQRRNKLYPDTSISKDFIFENLGKIVAYSQGAKSVLVEPMLDAGHLKRAVSEYRVDEAARLNPLDVVEEHWGNIKAIRKKSKIFHLIQMAREISGTMKKSGIGNFIADSGLPAKIRSDSDIDEFWVAFHRLREKLTDRDFPFIQAQTSLLHLLMEFGYDCAKPDSAVLKAAFGMGLIDAIPKNFATKSADKVCERVVRLIQHYAVARGLRPAVVDWYMLIEGGQTGAREYVAGTGYQSVHGR